MYNVPKIRLYRFGLAQGGSADRFFNLRKLSRTLHLSHMTQLVMSVASVSMQWMMAESRVN